MRLTSQTIRRFLILLGIMILLPQNAGAYVLPGPHLLELVVQKIKEPYGIVVHQQKQMMDLKPSGDSGLFEDTGFPEDTDKIIPETLWFSFPGKLRIEAAVQDQNALTLHVGGEVLKIINEMAVSDMDTPTDRYIDVLLYRDRANLQQRLKKSGIDVNITSLKRYNGSICYVIGNIKNIEFPSSSLWIDKETFFPIRYIVHQDHWYVEILYRNWIKVSKTWYPSETQIYLDKKPICFLNVESIELESTFPESFFNISRLKRMYPQEDRLVPADEHEQTSEIQESIENFNRLYE